MARGRIGDMGTGLDAFGAGTLIAMAFVMIAGLLWFLLPFAVFGIKPLLIRLANARAQTDKALLTEIQGLRADLAKAAGAGETPPSPAARSTHRSPHAPPG